jgi:hypothetical protein
MVRGLALASVALALLAAPAAAQNTCVQPYAPAIANGASATKEQMLTMGNEVREFIKASDTYQECIILDIQSQRAEAAPRQKQLDQSVVDSANARIATNQREKERVGREYNAAVEAYRKANPSQ